MGSVDERAATATLEDSANELVVERGGEDWKAGDRIGRYCLVEKLGAGGMGVVYLADDPELDRRVALKVVGAEARIDAQAGLVVEAQAMAKLQHPNVVAIYDVGMDRGRVFVAMELVLGITLRNWIRAERRRWREIVAAFVGAARGLAAAHRAGLVHRDFKPDNVLIDQNRVARLCDFGLARPPADARERSRAGTPPYMAPEQHDGDPITEAADQFAFAAALWEAVFGVLPFDGKDVAELAQAKRLGRISTPPRGLVPGWLIAVLHRALAPAPRGRFATLSALERVLERGLARQRRTVIASAIVAVIAGAFVVGGLRVSGDAAEPCGGATAEIAGIWSASARDRVTMHLHELGPYAANEVAPDVDRELASYSERWARSHHKACMANQRGEVTAEIYGRNLTCFERSRVALKEIVNILADVPAERISDARFAVRKLPDPEACWSQSLASTHAYRRGSPRSAPSRPPGS